MYHHRHEGLTIRRSFSLPKVPSAQPAFPVDDNAFVRNMGLHVMPDASWKVLRTYAGFAIFVMGVHAVDYQSQLIRVVCHSTAEAETVPLRASPPNAPCTSCSFYVSLVTISRARLATSSTARPSKTSLREARCYQAH